MRRLRSSRDRPIVVSVTTRSSSGSFKQLAVTIRRTPIARLVRTIDEVPNSAGTVSWEVKLNNPVPAGPSVTARSYRLQYASLCLSSLHVQQYQTRRNQ